jgi:hypothetical protein
LNDQNSGRLVLPLAMTQSPHLLACHKATGARIRLRQALILSRYYGNITGLNRPGFADARRP